MRNSRCAVQQTSAGAHQVLPDCASPNDRAAVIPRLEERRAMKASRFSDAQKAFILKQGTDGMPVADICRKGRDQPGDLFQLEEEI
jgi:hypothetical protein